MNPKDKTFQKLQKTWYSKLKKSGFSDIEQDETYFKSSPKIFRNKPEIEWIESKIEYYRAAGKFLYDYKFKSDLERYIWEQHSFGVSARTIADMLKEKHIKFGTTSVSMLIKRLAKVMIKDVITKDEFDSD